MKPFLFIICATCFMSNISLCQRHIVHTSDTLPIYDIFTPGSQEMVMNIHSGSFTRIFDGFLLIKQGYMDIKNSKINYVWRVSDTGKLKNLGIRDFSRPYMFLASLPSANRRFIYKESGIDYDIRKVNLPVILDNQLITPDKYFLLDKMDTSRIARIKYLRGDTALLKGKIILPLGVIEVFTNTEMQCH